MLGPLGETLQVLGAAGGDSTQNHPGVLREKPEGFVHCQHLQPRNPKLPKISGNPVEPPFSLSQYVFFKQTPRKVFRCELLASGRVHVPLYSQPKQCTIFCNKSFKSAIHFGLLHLKGHVYNHPWKETSEASSMQFPQGVYAFPLNLGFITTSTNTKT